MKFNHAILNPLTPFSNGTTTVYSMKQLREIPGITVEEPVAEVYFATLFPYPGDDTNLYFAAFEWNSETEDCDVEARLLFAGNGTAGNLRELRHTYWNPRDDGYLFYMPLAKTIAVLQAMQKHFEGD